MTNEGANPPSFNDMLDAWRRSAAEAEQHWNDYFNQMMGTEAFGRMMARSMDSYLTAHSNFTRGMEQYLQTLNIPTRADISQLSERLAMLEQKIDGIASMLGASAAVNPSEPAKRKGQNAGRRRSGKSGAETEGA